jgi:endogenous inhibitor of DNA gyrase (YacG/DUF329 family)
MKRTLTCTLCAKEFDVYDSQKRILCSPRCYYIYRRNISKQNAAVMNLRRQQLKQEYA